MGLVTILFSLVLAFWSGTTGAWAAPTAIELAIPSGRVLTAQVDRLEPPGVIPAAKLPALMVFGGFQHAATVLEQVHPGTAVIVASFDYPFSAPRKLKFPESLRFAPDAKRAAHETLEGIRALTDALRARPDVDPNRITILGASFGAPFALAAAAADTRLSGVVLIHGFGEPALTAAELMEKKWRERLGWFAKPAAWTFAQLAWAYLQFPTPEASALKLQEHQRVLMVSADADSFVPRFSSESLWSAIQLSPAQKLKIAMPGDHLRPGARSLVAKITGRVTEWMATVHLL